MLPIERLAAPLSPTDLAGLCTLLGDAVEGGASVGFMLPVQDTEMKSFWQDVFADVATGRRIVLVARDADRIVGSVQLELAGKPNSRHRAEVQKLLVLRPHRGRGLGYALVRAAEAVAAQSRRSLLVLDTSATGNAVGLYERCGYIRGGVIPRYACDPDGSFIDTLIYYKHLDAP